MDLVLYVADPYNIHDCLSKTLGLKWKSALVFSVVDNALQYITITRLHN